MAREWTERHIRELIRRYGAGGTTEAQHQDFVWCYVGGMKAPAKEHIPYPEYVTDQWILFALHFPSDPEGDNYVIKRLYLATVNRSGPSELTGTVPAFAAMYDAEGKLDTTQQIVSILPASIYVPAPILDVDTNMIPILEIMHGDLYTFDFSDVPFLSNSSASSPNYTYDFTKNQLEQLLAAANTLIPWVSKYDGREIMAPYSRLAMSFYDSASTQLSPYIMPTTAQVGLGFNEIGSDRVHNFVTISQDDQQNRFSANPGWILTALQNTQFIPLIQHGDMTDINIRNKYAGKGFLIDLGVDIIIERR